MLPPLLSSTMNAENVLGTKDQKTPANSQTKTESGQVGRPEKPDD